MFPRALKTNIIISIVILLILGMLLIDFVVVRTSQRDVILEKITKGYLTASLLEDSILMSLSNGSQNAQRRLKSRFADILSENDFSAIYLMGAMKQVIYSADKEFGLNEALEKLMRETFTTGKRLTKFSDTTWGVFWYQRKYLMIAVPVENDDGPYASIGILMNLEPIYAGQRSSQRFVLFYLAVNTLLLAVIGFFRLSKVYLEPINRLVRMAEEYQEADGIFFPVRKQDNELSKLSKALNLMVNRISEDKKRLKMTVDSLERTNLELQKAQGEILHAEKLASIGRLSSGIAHEIGNPIGIITGYLDLLKQETIPPDDKMDFVQRIEKEIQRMDTVIRQLLDLSRPSVVSAEIISVHDIIRDMKQVLGVQPLTSSIQVSLALDAVDDRVKADANQLRQVFLNLAINAADAIAADGKENEGALTIKTDVDVGASSLQEGQPINLKIMFIDDGPGIPPEYLGSIFDPFFTTKDPGKGTGLGLSVCFMIVESIGGKISAESSPGEGTTMTIWLPLAREPVNSSTA